MHRRRLCHREKNFRAKGNNNFKLCSNSRSIFLQLLTNPINPMNTVFAVGGKQVEGEDY
jgi:hypothetical protein